MSFVVVATCVRLGFWQLDRLHGRKDANAAIAAAEAMPPRPLTTLTANTADPSSLRFRPTVAAGTYDPAHEVLLYGRSSAEGQTGDQVLTPLRLGDGTAVIVDRGWIPLDQDVPVTGDAAAPSGTVRVAGILFPPDAISGPQADATPVDRVTEVDLGRIGAALPYPILPVYVLLQHQEPAQTGGLPEPPPLPPLTNGPHLSYAAQWFGFAAIALIGFVVLLRRDRTEAAAAASLPRTSGKEDA